MGHEGSTSITVWIHLEVDAQIIEHTHPTLPTAYAFRFSALTHYGVDGHREKVCATKAEAWAAFTRYCDGRFDPRNGMSPKALLLASQAVAQ